MNFTRKCKKGWEMAVLISLAMTIHETGTIAGKPGHRDNVAKSGIVLGKPGRLEYLYIRRSLLWHAKIQKSRLYYLIENSKNQITIRFAKIAYLGNFPKLNFVFRELIFWHTLANIFRERSISSILNFRELFRSSYVLQW